MASSELMRKRFRRFVPKVRTGCITCKIRHVKCDEKKPACLKCIDTGRICDGYAIITKLGSGAKTASESHMILARSPSCSIQGTGPERRSFDFFKFQTGREWAQVMPVPNWHQVILQASHTDPVIRHAVVAIGSLGERLLVNKVLMPGNPKADACHVYACQQYHIALALLRNRLESQGEQHRLLAFVSCMLFLVYEFLQGNAAGVAIHFMSGVKLIHELYGKVYSSGKVMTPPISAGGPKSMKEDAVQVFTILDMHLGIWLGMSYFDSPVIQPLLYQQDTMYCKKSKVKEFDSLDEAATSIICQINQIFHFRRFFLPPFTDSTYAAAVEEANRLKSLLMQWPTSLEHLVMHLRPTLSPKDLHRIGVLEINYHLASVIIKASFAALEEGVYASLEAHFSWIVNTAASLLNPPASSKKKADPLTHDHFRNCNNPPTSVFSFPVGIIAALYITAIKCPSRKISEQAIFLLSTRPWREGAWDSAALARIAQQMVARVDAEGRETPNPVVTNAPIISPADHDVRRMEDIALPYVYSKLAVC